MNFSIATSLKEVQASWGIVYRQYLKNHFIDPNPYQLFTFPEYISSNSITLMGIKDQECLCTISAVADSSNGLPLDKVFKPELDGLRSQGKTLIEVGLSASQEDPRCSGMDIIRMMGYIGKYSIYHQNADLVIGVPPRKVKFFERLFGYQVVSQLSAYKSLQKAPVVLLHASHQKVKNLQLPLILDALKAPYTDLFHQRFDFAPEKYANTQLDKFLQETWNLQSFKSESTLLIAS
ncbi:hypothetical protein AAG747_23185 [Rapidithrix thailandica]|uniref:N-acyl amino acid synthase FeeM catalytic core domain-containing protein n=1 Tax=Rapidithrix thailandica TaxID=413964 RepID=A0AAW9S0Z4_9BACT